MQSRVKNCDYNYNCERKYLLKSIKHCQMKKLYFISFLLITAFTSLYAQADTTKLEYCEMTTTKRSFSNKVNVEFDFGEGRKSGKDNLLKDETGKVKNFDNVVDAMNYLGTRGWKLVTASLGVASPYYYIFRREVLK